MADNNIQQQDPDDDNGVMGDDEGFGDPAEELDPTRAITVNLWITDSCTATCSSTGSGAITCASARTSSGTGTSG